MMGTTKMRLARKRYRFAVDQGDLFDWAARHDAGCSALPLNAPLANPLVVRAIANRFRLSTSLAAVVSAAAGYGAFE
jgi:hypothetical protein